MGKKSKRSKSSPSTASQNPIASGKPGSPKEMVELINHLPDAQREQVTEGLMRTLRIERTFIGPLPPPEDFAKYEQVMPGTADRILAMAEKEQQIRADGQDKILANDKRRINGAALLGIALIVVAGIATWQGYIGIALPLGLSGVISALLRQLLVWRDSRAQSNR